MTAASAEQGVSPGRERIDHEVLDSATCYLVAARTINPETSQSIIQKIWPLLGPFEPYDDPVDNLCAAVELINSEIDRIQRYREIDRDALDWHGR